MPVFFSFCRLTLQVETVRLASLKRWSVVDNCDRVRDQMKEGAAKFFKAAIRITKALMTITTEEMKGERVSDEGLSQCKITQTCFEI